MRCCLKVIGVLLGGCLDVVGMLLGCCWDNVGMLLGCSNFGNIWSKENFLWGPHFFFLILYINLILTHSKNASTQHNFAWYWLPLSENLAITSAYPELLKF